MPKRYIAVERFSAVLLTWKVWLACVFAMDSAAPAHAWTKIRRERMAMFLARDFSGHYAISCQPQMGQLVSRSCIRFGGPMDHRPQTRAQICDPPGVLAVQILFLHLAWRDSFLRFLSTARFFSPCVPVGRFFCIGGRTT
jgi:hypothetical protein